MSHLPLSLMNRLSQNESVVFKLLVLYFTKDLFSDYCQVLSYGSATPSVSIRRNKMQLQKDANKTQTSDLILVY